MSCYLKSPDLTLVIADSRAWVYHHVHEYYVDNCILEHYRFDGDSIAVWDARILQPLLVPLMQQGSGLIFQQDNAHTQTARLTQNFLKVNGFNIFDWSIMSLDLIKSDWTFVKWTKYTCVLLLVSFSESMRTWKSGRTFPGEPFGVSVSQWHGY